MPGRPLKRAKEQAEKDSAHITNTQAKKDLRQARQQITLLESQIRSLKSELARVNPDAINKSLEEAPYPPDDELCNRILALGEIGLTPKQIQAEFIWSDAQWVEAMSMYPKFSSAVSRACTRAQGHWTQRIHDALNNHDWTYPYEKAMSFVATQFDTGAAVDGNAVDVVHVSIGREARALFSREVEAA